MFGGRGNLFGGRDQSPQPDSYAQPSRRPQQPGYSDYDTPMNGAPDSRSYGRSPAPSQPGLPARPGGRPQPPQQQPRGGSGQSWRLTPTKAPDNSYTFRNL